MTLNELIEKFNGEQVGDRIIATVGGKREYIANIVMGGYALTHYGEKLVQLAAATAAEEAPKPKRKKKSEDVELDDLLNGVEE